MTFILVCRRYVTRWKARPDGQIVGAEVDDKVIKFNPKMSVLAGIGCISITEG